MKFSLLSALVAGAALVQVGASPLRVVVVTGIQDNSPKLRLGHAGAHHNNNGRLDVFGNPIQTSADGKMRGPCRGARLRQKASELSNAFRQALGFGPSKQPEVAHGEGMVHILPFIGTPPTFVASNPAPVHHNGNVVYMPHPHPHPHHRPKQTLHFYRPFTSRLHQALMTLGPWEGRAVAFVLGCGIGVLLRMLWVLSVVSYRIIRGTKEDENKYTEILVVEDFGNDAEELFVAPPDYSYPAEKVDKPIVPSTEVAK